jgi:hypothetical protein
MGTSHASNLNSLLESIVDKKRSAPDAQRIAEPQYHRPHSRVHREVFKCLAAIAAQAFGFDGFRAEV